MVGSTFIELRGYHQRGDNRPAPRRHQIRRTGGSCEPRAEGSGRAFDRVVVEFDAPVVEEAAERVPTGQCVADCIDYTATRRDAVEFGFQAKSS